MPRSEGALRWGGARHERAIWRVRPNNARDARVSPIFAPTAASPSSRASSWRHRSIPPSGDQPVALRQGAAR